MRGSLQEICAQARDAQNISMQQLIDETGIPEGTVKNFFASCSKNPSVYNAGLICSVLGISLDEYFGIEPVLTTEDKLAQANEQFCAPYLWLLSWDISFLTTVSPTRGLFRAERPVYSHGLSFCCLQSVLAFLPLF